MSLDELLDTLHCLRGQPREVTPLVGGLTNANYRVRTPDRDVVVRVSTKDSSLLSIDRDAEYANSAAAAESGVAPAVVEYSPDNHLLVVEHIPARTLAADDLHDTGMLERVAEVVRDLHQGSRFVTDFDMFDVQRGYLETVQRHGFPLPAGYQELEPYVARVEGALRATAVETVPCNNDLLAANLLDDGSRLWLIDYEYAGNNDPFFELGNLAGESHLSTAELATLVSAYVGGHRAPSLVARAVLWAAVAQYGWTLWASIQAATSSLDFDFETWGMDKYDRAVGTLAGPNLDALLAAIAADETRTGESTCPKPPR